MDGWMEGRTAGWMDGRADGWMDGWKIKHKKSVYNTDVIMMMVGSV